MTADPLPLNDDDGLPGLKSDSSLSGSKVFANEDLRSQKPGAPEKPLAPQEQVALKLNALVGDAILPTDDPIKVKRTGTIAGQGEYEIIVPRSFSSSELLNEGVTLVMEKEKAKRYNYDKWSVPAEQMAKLVADPEGKSDEQLTAELRASGRAGFEQAHVETKGDGYEVLFRAQKPGMKPINRTPIFGDAKDSVTTTRNAASMLIAPEQALNEKLGISVPSAAKSA